jgi:hypothetical protein
MTEQVGNELFRYTVDAYCKKQIQLAISSMRKPQAESAPAVSQRRDPASSENKNLQFFATNEQSDFDAIESAIDRAKCVIICTSSEDPLSYFWLGFAHGNQKQVIPITALPSREDGGRDATASSSDMPFDVRALWHIHFDKGDPKTLRSSLVDILHHLLRDEDIANRKEFWRDILEEGTVSLFVGAVALGDRSRNVVGEWDYRTMAELCGFLVRLKETTEIMIQPPLYRASEKKKGAELEQYIDDLGRKLLANNAIVIATPDSNDMTEVALARLADKSAFKNDRRDNDPDFCGIVAVKTERDVKGGNCRYYRYEDLSRDQGTKLDPKRTRRTDTKRAKTPDAKRGFIDYYKGQELKERYWHQYGDHTLKHPDGYTFYHGHLAKFRLREATKANDSENAEARWVIVVQGITGPATLGLAQILTGAHYKHFTVFDDAYPEEDRNRLLLSVAKHAESLRDLRGRPIAGDADPSKSLMEQHAEEMARKMNEECEKHGSVEAIVRIYISDSHPDHDERLLIWWEFEEGFPRVASVHARHYPSSTGEGLDAEAAVARKTEVHSTG